MLVVAGNQPMLRQRVQIGRPAITGEISRAGAHHPALSGYPAGVQPTVFLLADANGGIQQFLRRIGLALRQIQFNKQLRITFSKQRQQRQDIGFAEGRQTTDA
ncbi:hypothetical protein D3C81_1714320 [compost metagenome]